MKDEKKKKLKRKGTWLEATDAYWNLHNHVMPVTYGSRPKSDRWACFCGKTFTYNYDTNDWESDD